MKLNDEWMVEGLTEEQLGQLETYESLLRRKAVGLGLISRGDAARIRDRHINDALRVLPCLGQTGRLVVDMGSGAGLPGIPVAIARPDCAVTLVDRRAKAVGFLELAVEKLGLTNVRVMPGSLDLAAVRPDVCLARALAPADEVWRLARPLLGERGFAVYWAGRGWKRADVRDSDVTAEICAKPLFSWQGPLVIMKLSFGPPTKEPTHER